EGWTNWAERRILEELHGPDAAALSWAIGDASLRASMQRFGADSPLTRLRTHLAGVDPDDAYSTVPYEKGARFIAALERAAGRERFDRFVRAYLAHFRFTSITTEEFLEFLEQEMPGLAERAGAGEWVHGTGMPAGVPQFTCTALTALDEAAAA